MAEYLDITDIVRLRRRCAHFAFGGFSASFILLLLALAYPVLFLLIIPLFITSILGAKGNQRGALIQAIIAGVLVAILIFDQLSSRIQFHRPSVLLSLIALVAFILSLLGLRTTIIYQRLLPSTPYAKDDTGLSVWLARTLVFLRSGKLRYFLPNFLLFIVFIMIGIGSTIWIMWKSVSLAQHLLELGFPLLLFLCGYIFSMMIVIMGSYFFYTQAKRGAALSLKEIRGYDQRSPILLLRSFQDDLTPLYRKLPLTIWQPSDFYAGVYTLEEAIERVLRRYGPVIAIGRPGENIPPVGAAREYVSNAEWQSKIKDYISQARLVVIILGKTPGLFWEYQHLAELSVWGKLVALFPPVDEKEMQERWSLFLEAKGDEYDPKILSDPSKVLLVTYSDDGIPRFLTCKWKNDEECYNLALHCGLAAGK